LGRDGEGEVWGELSGFEPRKTKSRRVPVKIGLFPHSLAALEPGQSGVQRTVLGRGCDLTGLGVSAVNTPSSGVLK
jgi:hypothetical protein